MAPFTLEAVPTLQSIHAALLLAPTCELQLPAKHATQVPLLVAPTCALQVPAPHAVQLFAAGPAHDPGAHTAHGCRPALALPAGHNVQFPEREGALPGGQMTPGGPVEGEAMAASCPYAAPTNSDPFTTAGEEAIGEAKDADRRGGTAQIWAPEAPSSAYTTPSSALTYTTPLPSTQREEEIEGDGVSNCHSTCPELIVNANTRPSLSPT